ncbi:hypothetical protein [Litoreibacter roseus]|uniref:Uncharacterized protein n=1 Tax=Litoreibacter roseus TaxID=2601869 RepID=A0A6N6JBS9_9RHOB|nr:hypothetical protein [Litoreibacter roseus]GFE63447.1 hypothetical protein KIN_05210 [Litoreibacter roseus]
MASKNFKFLPAVSTALFAGILALTSLPAAADDHMARFIEAPTNYGIQTFDAPGRILSATYVDDVLTIDFVVPDHKGDRVVQLIGSRVDDYSYKGEATGTDNDGRKVSLPVSLKVEPDGTMPVTIGMNGLQGVRGVIYPMD